MFFDLLNFAGMTFVFQNDSNINSDIGGGRKPIHYAADFGQNEVIEYLLAKGADINVSKFNNGVLLGWEV